MNSFSPWSAKTAGSPLFGAARGVLALLLCGGLAGAHAAQAAPGGFQPDAAFLKQDPDRKTKQLVQLTGLRSAEDQAVVQSAINDVIGFVRLFGVAGSNLGQAVIPGSTPERMAQIKAASKTWRAFEARSTPGGRAAMPIEPASGHILHSMADWRVESDAALSVVADFRMTQFELQPVKDPLPRVLRLRFVRQGNQWLFDGAGQP